MGDRLSNLNTCAQLIEAQIGPILKRSSVYETAAWGKTNQPGFLNQALQVKSALLPIELLGSCLAIEKKLGRIRNEKWAERTIDIDIIYFDNEIIDREELKIPHPRLAERRFVLMPLVEINPEFVHPVLKKTNRELLAVCPDKLSVDIYQPG